MSQLMNESLNVSIDTSNESSERVSRRSSRSTRGRIRSYISNRETRLNPIVNQRVVLKGRRIGLNRTNPSINSNNNNNNQNTDVIMGQMIGTNNSMPVLSEELTERADNEINSMAINETQNNDNNTNNDNNNNSDNRREVVILNQMCIDLTQDESIVNENGVESDSEIQCISAFIRNPPNPELAIIRETNNNRNRSTNGRESVIREIARERSPNTRRVLNDEIIEIINSQTNPRVSIVETNSKERLRKAIKCPICLDEDSSFEISGRQLVSTNCGHVFCDRCIKEVIKTSKVCPNCRKRVSTQKSFHPLYI